MCNLMYLICCTLPNRCRAYERCVLAALFRFKINELFHFAQSTVLRTFSICCPFEVSFKSQICTQHVLKLIIFFYLSGSQKNKTK